jgi:hypothetical protein
MDADFPIGREELVQTVRSEQERAVTAAYQLESAIVNNIKAIRAQWARLAECLFQFDLHDVWQTLGYDSLNQWLAGPDIEMSRSMFYGLVRAYRTLVVEGGATIEQLARIDYSKAQEVLPAVRRNFVDVGTAIADAEVLSKSDLRERYSGDGAPVLAGSVDQPVRPDAFHWEVCKSCGAKRKVVDD